MLRQLLLLCLSSLVFGQQDSGTRIQNIGYGSFIIIVSVIIWIIICIGSRSTQRPELYSLLGALLPIFFILFFVLTPKVSQQSGSSQISDSNFVPHIIFVILALIMFVTSVILYCGDILFVYKRAKSIARVGVRTVSGDEDKSKLNEQNAQGSEGEEMGSQNALLESRHQQ